MKKLAVILIMILPFFAAGQVNCDNAVEEGNDLYTSGRYDESIKLLEEALKSCGLTKTKRDKAYAILINCSIEKDSLNAVDNYFVRLLQKNPLFDPKDNNELDDFEKYYNNYTVLPKFSISLRKSIFAPFYPLGKTYTVLPDADYTTPYLGLSKFSGGNLGFEYRRKEKNSLNIELAYVQMDYSRDITKDNLLKLNYSENLSYIEVPLYVKRYFRPKKKLNFNIAFGYNNHILLKSEASLIDTITHTDPFDDAPLTSTNKALLVDIKNMRNKYLGGFIIGTAMNYKLGYFTLSLDARYVQSFSLANNKYNRYINSDFIRTYYYIDNDFRVGRIELAFTIQYHIKYQVTKKNK